MGRSRYRILQTQQPHFVTCTVLNWIPLFTRPATAQIVLDALLYRQQQHGWRLYGYVILENQLHLVVQANNLSNQLAHFKSYTARQLIDYLHEAKAERLLSQFKWCRKAHKSDRDYQLIPRSHAPRGNAGLVRVADTRRGAANPVTTQRVPKGINGNQE